MLSNLGDNLKQLKVVGFVNFLCPTTLWANKHVTDKVISRYDLLVPTLAFEVRLYRLNLHIRTFKGRSLGEDNKCLQQRFFGEGAAPSEPNFRHAFDFLLLQLGQQFVNERFYDIKFVHEPSPLWLNCPRSRTLLWRSRNYRQVSP